MKVTFFINYLNHHQVLVADEMHRLLGDDFRFVATFPRNPCELKGGIDYSTRPYCLLAAEKHEHNELAHKLNLSSDVCVFGAGNLEWERERASTNKLSFEISERWFKRGWINVFSPRLLKWWWLYQTKLHCKSFYKLCASGFTASDCNRLLTFRNRCYRWGYFTSVPDIKDEKYFEASEGVSKIKILWVARFLSLNHPELPLLMAKRLKEKGKIFELDYYGSGPKEEKTRQLAHDLGLDNVVTFHGAVPNDKVYDAMLNADVFLFTSDSNEGWGAVANESMANACVLVASDAIGSTPYLIKDGCNGLVFRSKDVESLTEKVEWLLNNPAEIRRLKRNAYNTMKELWNPSNAAISLLRLLDDLQNGRELTIKEGPCSKA